MFAFALWDEDAKQLILARDRMGIKPLLLANDGETVAFGSELPALLAADIDHGGLDPVAFAHSFGAGFIPAPKTAFDNVSKLCPGEMAIVSEEGIRRKLFYTPSVSAHNQSIEAAATVVRDRVEHAVERRLQSDVPLGAFLSGGIDSSIIVSVLTNLLDQEVKTFTVGFEAERFDEAAAAQTVAEHYGTDHTEFTVTAAEVRETVPEVLGRLGEPFADQSLIPTYVVCRETSQEVKVALSGDGADELFAGYDRYRGEYMSRYYRVLPKALRQKLIEPAVSQLPASRESPAGEFGRLARKFIRGGIADASDRHFEWMRIPDHTAATTIAHDPIRVGRRSMAEQHDSVRSWLPSCRQSDLSEMQSVDVRYTLPNQMLQKVDTASMYNSLEVRVPFLDTSVVEYAIGLPTEFKITARTRKQVLRRAFKHILPDETLQRDKQGFDMPIGEWFKNELAEEFRLTVGSLETEILDIDGVMDIYREHVAGDAEHGKFLWTVYVFAIWLEQMRRDDIL
jgi:asparagine synthase (glutamine-hydrolysing)